MDKLHIKETIIVEGRYDKAALANVTDADILILGGFRFYNNPGLLELIRSLAAGNGVIVLTDSDRAGFQLRNYIKGAVPGAKHCYIPDVYGKERRKEYASKEGKLGVEGMTADALREVLKPFAAGAEASAEFSAQAVTNAELYELGYSGGSGAAVKRREFCRANNLPERISVSALLTAVNSLPELAAKLRET
ncbi:MAG: DUF4093 domain-containing protein [Oscillospiraceae bacterium]|jgi:ribonuclease M5|nr:DUF4093 domain-containing protein [Oscillospiraceae bacterium]